MNTKNSDVQGLERVTLRLDGVNLDRVAYVRPGSRPGNITFMISGYNEPALSMRRCEEEPGVSTTIVYLARRLTATQKPVRGLTTQSLSDQVLEVEQMVTAYLQMCPGRHQYAVLHGHSMGAVIALRALVSLRHIHQDIHWHVITEAPPPWERAPLWFSNKSFWGNGGWAALGDAMKALTTNRIRGEEGMVANRDTLYRLYAGGQPQRDQFDAAYASAVLDAPYAFMELAFASGLGDEDALRAALHEVQSGYKQSGLPAWQVVCFLEDRIFHWKRILDGVRREARVVDECKDDGSMTHDSRRASELGPNVYFTCVPSVPHVPSWGSDQRAYRKAVYDCYRRLMF